MSTHSTAPLARPKPREVRRFEGAKGWLEVGILAPGVVYEVGEGHASEDIGQSLCTRLDELVVRFGKVQISDDWYGITGYDAGARRVVEGWTTKNRGSIERIHVLLSSKLVAMAVSVSNLVTGGVTTAYTKRADFDRALAAALAGRSG